MVSESPVSYIQCPSCLRRNHSEMQFCIYCGAGVTPEAERKRKTVNPLTWRTCARCGQTDELNQNFCIFCSGKIVVPGSEQLQQDNNAYRKFSWELEQIDSSRLIDKSDELPVQQPVKVKVKRAKKSSTSIGVTVLLAILGILAGAGLSFLIGQTGLERVVLQSTTWQKKDLVVYTTVKNADITIENENKMFHTLTKAGEDGSLSVADLPSGKYLMTITTPSGAVARVKFPVVENRTTVLGFPNRIDPTKSKSK